MRFKSLLMVATIVVAAITAFAFSDMNAEEKPPCGAEVELNPDDYFIGFSDCSHVVVSPTDANYPTLVSIAASAMDQADALAQIDASGLYPGKVATIDAILCCTWCYVYVPESCDNCNGKCTTTTSTKKGPWFTW